MPSAKAAGVIAESLERLYGSAIEVRYHDVDDAETAEAAAEVLGELEDSDLPLPVVALDGEILFAGAVDPLRVVAAVAMELRRRRERLEKKHA